MRRLRRWSTRDPRHYFGWARRTRRREVRGASMYLVPAAFVIGAMVLNNVVFGLASVYAEFLEPVAEQYDSQNMSGLLTAVVGSMMTITGIVFSVLMLTVQHAGATISPRVVRTFYRDRVVKYALGFFVGTLTFALMTIGDLDDPGGAVATGVGLILVLVAIIVFLKMIDHVGQTLRSAAMVARVGEATHTAVHRVFRRRSLAGNDGEFRAGDDPTAIPHRGPTGIVIGINWAALERIARRTGNPMDVKATVGDPVAGGEGVVHASRPVSWWVRSRILDQIAVGDERAIDVDPGFGLRILVDTASKALSPGVNDPTTAVAALDQIEALLTDIGSRDLSGVHSAWLRGPATTWDGVVDLALSEITFFGASSFQVTRRLMSLFNDLGSLPETRQPALRRHRADVVRRVTAAHADPGDLAFALSADAQGISATGFRGNGTRG